MLKKTIYSALTIVVLAAAGLGVWQMYDPDVADCEQMLKRGLLPIAADRADRFLGKVREDTARCRGGERAVALRDTPWVDWTNYWATGDEASKSGPYEALTVIGKHLGKNGRGMDGSLVDLEFLRIGLVKFNLFDNYTFDEYITGRDKRSGRILDTWPEMRLPEAHPNYAEVVVDGGDGRQLCKGDLIRHRTVNGICNDTMNPAMGSTGMVFARNIEFEQTFPLSSDNELVRNRHGDRLGLLKPDPQVISRKVFTRAQSETAKCNVGKGLPGHDRAAHCDYKKAPFFNVLAAYWIQFMTHDWFSHLEEARNAPETMAVGCTHERVDNKIVAMTPAQIKQLGCRPADRMEKVLIAQSTPPGKFKHDGRTYQTRAAKTTRNKVTAWWDGSQIYGYDARSLKRVKRDLDDRAKLLMRKVKGRVSAGDERKYLPVFETCDRGPANCTPDPINPEWVGQEATAFPDNWTVGLSFYHNLFVREHNAFVDAFRQVSEKNPDQDSGLRNPGKPTTPIAYREVSDDELFQIARLVVTAEIAKIHTIEWTTQLLYDEPLYTGMNSNWFGLIGDHPRVDKALASIIARMRKSSNADLATLWYSVLASGPGIIGTGSKKKGWSLQNPEDINDGTNHFGSPFNFPEEFITVYRLHALLPDLLEMRQLKADPNMVVNKVPVIDTFRNLATDTMHQWGLGNVALSLGRQRLGLLALQNHPRFLQNLKMPKRLHTPNQTIDVVALDIIRDRERGVPRYNEFRRQFGLKQLTSFDDFIDRHLLDKSDLTAPEQAALADQKKLAALLREVYGSHKCEAGKIISRSQKDPAGTAAKDGVDKYPNDCLGHTDGSQVDNIEDLDTVVGWLAETTRSHGFAISETQFQVFILNASRRLYSDRFFTSSFRPEFYSQFGLDWVKQNGPTAIMEKGEPNGHKQAVSPLKRILLRVLPELKEELDPVINVFDPWARDRGEYYSLQWKPRPDAEDDSAFK